MRTIIVSALFLGSVLAGASEDGYLYGDNHCFHFSAPSGWVADHTSGRNQGLAFVFYPRDSSWANATTVIYARVANKTESLREPRDQVERTLQQFRTEYQSPGIQAQKVGALTSKTGAVAEIYRFTGDQWGNTELVAYFTGKRTINFFVMSSRDANDSEKNRKVLEELAQSYREAEDCNRCTEPSCGGRVEARPAGGGR